MMSEPVVTISAAACEELRRAADHGYSDGYAGEPTDARLELERRRLIERHPVTFGSTTVWRITQRGEDYAHAIGIMKGGVYVG